MKVRSLVHPENNECPRQKDVDAYGVVGIVEMHIVVIPRPSG